MRGYPGQLGHRRQIAQWSGTRTSHPRGTGFETGPPPKLGSACPHARRGFFRPRIHAPGCFQKQKYCFRSSPGVLLQTASNETPSLRTPPDPGNPADWCHQVPPRPSLPHAPGVRMTVVNNSLKLTFPRFPLVRLLYTLPMTTAGPSLGLEGIGGMLI